MNKNILKLAIALIFILGAGFASWYFFHSKVYPISIQGHQFKLEVAGTPEKRELGLGKRKSLCHECGMLFVFSEPENYSFWMKDMLFPLDIIWFDSADGKIIHIEKNIPADSKEIYTSPGKADRVLEINSGLSDQYGIEAGDKIQSKR